jgi:hypothetical protein
LSELVYFTRRLYGGEFPCATLTLTFENPHQRLLPVFTRRDRGKPSKPSGIRFPT